MKRILTDVLIFSLPGLLCLLGACEKEGGTIYVEDKDYVSTLSLALDTDLPSKIYLSDAFDFSVNVASRYAGIASLKAQLVVSDQVLAEVELPAADQGIAASFSGTLAVPFVPNLPVGAGELKFIAKNVNGGIREFPYDITVERPDFRSLTLVHARGNYTVPRTGQYQYHLEGNIPDDGNAYLQSPPFGPQNKVLTFKLSEAKGGVQVDTGDTGIPIGRNSAGKSVFSFNTETFAYHLPQHAYLYNVWGNETQGMPPAESPFKEIVLSRNKKAVDSRGRTGNRITYPWGGNARFTLNPGSEVLDGFSGAVRSVITAANVQVNLGSKKVINGKPCFFGFSFATTEGQQSGWIYEERINDPYHMELCGADFAIDLTPAAIYGDAPVQYHVMAADPAPWVSLKVRRNISRAEHVAVSDYLDRGDGTVYLLYALPYFGGYANESVLGDGQPVFIPEAGIPRMILKVFLPTDPTQADLDAYADPAKQQLEWVFGRIGTARGWIPAINLQEIVQ